MKSQSISFWVISLALAVLPGAAPANSPEEILKAALGKGTRKLPQTLDSAACTDLFQVSCMKGEFDDGTGTPTNRAKHDAKTKTMAEAEIPNAQKDLVEIFKSPGSRLFLEAALDLFGQQKAPDCETPADGGSRAESCLQRIAKLAATRILNDASKDAISYAALEAEPKDDVDLHSKLSFFMNPDFQKLTEKYTARMVSHLTDKEHEEKRIRPIFDSVKAGIIEKLSGLVPDEGKRERLTAKIAAIQFTGTDCARDVFSSYLTTNANYIPYANEVRVCRGLLAQGDSEFLIAYALAHEISHGIDPCNIQRGPSTVRVNYPKPDDRLDSEKNSPFGGVVSCLRSADSVNAYPPMEKKAVSAKSTATRLPTAKTGTRVTGGGEDPAHDGHEEDEDPETLHRDPFCNPQDQIGETFSDWLAAEVVPDMMMAKYKDLTPTQVKMGYANIGRPHCEGRTAETKHDESDLDEHPDPKKRINRILLANPKVRAHMGCPAELPGGLAYCDAKSDSSKLSPPVPRPVARAREKPDWLNSLPIPDRRINESPYEKSIPGKSGRHEFDSRKTGKGKPSKSKEIHE